MNSKLLFLLLLPASIIHTMDLDQRIEIKKNEIETLNSAIFKHFCNSNFTEAQKILPRTSQDILPVFRYGIDRNHTVFIQWLLSTETAHTGFYSLQSVHRYAKNNYRDEIARLIKNHIAFQECKQKQLIVENNPHKQNDCECIIL